MTKLNRNVFDLTHDRKLSCDMGKLIPILCEEVLPGDHFRVATSIVARLNPLIAPIMHRVDVFTHYFFVPNRLVWADWEKFITGGTDGKDSTTWPYKAVSGIAAGDLLDYFGYPIGSIGTFNASILPARCYAKIYNDWYLDQNNQTPITFSTGSGADTTTSITLLSRCWEKDYFTSALPWAQRGDPVTLPLGSSAPVVYKTGVGQAARIMEASGDSVTGAGDLLTNGSGAMLRDSNGVYLDPNGTLEANLGSATAATINSIRQAFQIQKWMEKNARAGVRYVESILAHFGVRSSDQRLQRSEFLGGGRSPVVISEVLQTSETTANYPQGNMAGHGFSAQQTHAFSKAFEEHGYIIGIMSVLPRTAYQQGISRCHTRATRYDYYWPEFAHLGEQAILNKELYVANDGANENVFGYQGRYDEYRRRESSVHGLFRTTSSGLAHWHMGRIFNSRPTLSSAFVTADPTTRILAVPSQPALLMNIYNNVKAVRAIPLVGEPGMVDH